MEIDYKQEAKSKFEALARAPNGYARIRAAAEYALYAKCPKFITQVKGPNQSYLECNAIAHQIVSEEFSKGFDNLYDRIHDRIDNYWKPEAA